MLNFIKSILKLILDDVLRDLRACGVVIIFLLLSMITVSVIDDDMIAIRIIGVIALVVFSIAFFYTGK
jgi:hypothetical protein